MTVLDFSLLQMMTDWTPRQETRGRTTHGFVRNTIESYKDCDKRTHIPRVSQEELRGLAY